MMVHTEQAEPPALDEGPIASPTVYGSLPEDLGFIDLRPTEMMFWLYCPVQTPRHLHVPDNLKQFWPILDAVWRREGRVTLGRYMYVTAKTLWVEGSYIGNRPGWHSDGFGTDDLNYVWCDRAPTDFYEDSFTLPEDCADAMAIMSERAADKQLVHYPDKHLLRLTPAVIHRSPVGFAPGMRTFVKVSVSDERYNLEGNSQNFGLGETWPLLPRDTVRNHPVRADYVPPNLEKRK